MVEMCGRVEFQKHVEFPTLPEIAEEECNPKSNSVSTQHFCVRFTNSCRGLRKKILSGHEL